MLHWALAPDGLFVICATLVLAVTACVLGPSRAKGPLALVTLLLWALATPFMAASSPTLRGGIAAALWVAFVVGFAALPLGLLVARSAAARTIVMVASAVLVVQIPASFVAQVFLQCYVGHYCPGL